MISTRPPSASAPGSGTTTMSVSRSRSRGGRRRRNWQLSCLLPPPSAVSTIVATTRGAEVNLDETEHTAPSPLTPPRLELMRRILHGQQTVARDAGRSEDNQEQGRLDEQGLPLLRR